MAKYLIESMYTLPVIVVYFVEILVSRLSNTTSEIYGTANSDEMFVLPVLPVIGKFMGWFLVKHYLLNLKFYHHKLSTRSESNKSLRQDC